MPTPQESLAALQIIKNKLVSIYQNEPAPFFPMPQLEQYIQANQVDPQALTALLEQIRDTLLQDRRGFSINKAKIPDINAVLHLMAFYWPLSDRCAITNEQLSPDEQLRSIPLITGHLVSEKAL